MNEMKELREAATKEDKKNSEVLEGILKELKSINKRQAKSDKKNGLLAIILCLITIYVSIAIGLIEKELAQHYLNGFFDVLFWWMNKGD